MKAIRFFIIFILIPLAIGYVFASRKQPVSKQQAAPSTYNTSAVLPKDKLTFTVKGQIITLTQSGIKTIPTNKDALIEAAPLGSNFIGVDKQTNYSSLLEFSPSGTVAQTLLSGNTSDIDNDNWYTDPMVSASQNQIALVSDQDKNTTNVYDNALYIYNLSTGTMQKIIDPIPSTGGIAHPIWDPVDSSYITFDNYEYDQNYNPYSQIVLYNTQTQNSTNLTTQDQNAYQGAFSPDGKYFVFLTRNDNIFTKMYIANFSVNGLTNIRLLATGDFAYPEFSNSPNHIYYLTASANSGYDLYTAGITGGKLTQNTPVTTGGDLLGNSGFVVTQK